MSVNDPLCWWIGRAIWTVTLDWIIVVTCFELNGLVARLFLNKPEKWHLSSYLLMLSLSHTQMHCGLMYIVSNKYLFFWQLVRHIRHKHEGCKKNHWAQCLFSRETNQSGKNGRHERAHDGADDIVSSFEESDDKLSVLFPQIGATCDEILFGSATLTPSFGGVYYFHELTTQNKSSGEYG